MPTGLRTTQFSILAELKLLGPMTINALAEIMVMDRTTLGRNILPLQREGLIDISAGRSDRRSKELRLTVTGIEKVREARRVWAVAQRQFESAFGRARASDLRAELGAVAACDL
jgi:DNA-binding MarR family transcriptional regulator